MTPENERGVAEDRFHNAQDQALVIFLGMGQTLLVIGQGYT